MKTVILVLKLKMSRYLGGAELYSARCHDHYNLNVMVALTIHTRAPLDIGMSQQDNWDQD